MGHKIIDNFLDTQDFLQIKSIFESGTVPWYSSDIVYEEKEDNFQLVHLLYANYQPLHSGLNYIQKIIQKIDPLTIYRIKINLRPKSNIINDDYYHFDQPNLVDLNIHHTLGIFYLNTNNGYTILDNGTKIESVENRMLFLSGDTKHSGSSSTDSNRITMNLIFLNEETSSLYETK